MTSDFKDHVALVTGSGRGIGRAIALHLARAGADVVVSFFRNRATAQGTAEEIRAMGRRALVVRADMGQPRAIDSLFSETETEFGALDILICNAASGYNRPVMDQRVKGWDWTLNINARSVLLSAQRATPLMEKRGRGYIVTLSSLGSTRVLRDYAVVGASKAAIEALTRYLAVELAPWNIVVNAVSPGLVRTEALQSFSAIRGEETARVLAASVARTPAGRMVTKEDVANLVAFLCTPQAEMIRGQTIVMDGGASLPILEFLGT
jgi:enoyl-[acyl-carrier protein] reductase III